MRPSPWIWALAGLLLLPAPGAAQRRPGPPADRTELERRVRARFAEIVRAELGLTAEQLQEVERVVGSFLAERQALARRGMELRGRLQSGAAGRTPEESRQLLREMAALREEEARIMRTEMDALLRTLDPSQALRFYQLREDLTVRVRRLQELDRGRRGLQAPVGTQRRR